MKDRTRERRGENTGKGYMMIPYALKTSIFLSTKETICIISCTKSCSIVQSPNHHTHRDFSSQPNIRTLSKLGSRLFFVFESSGQYCSHIFLFCACFSCEEFQILYQTQAHLRCSRCRKSSSIARISCTTGSDIHIKGKGKSLLMFMKADEDVIMLLLGLVLDYCCHVKIFVPAVTFTSAKALRWHMFKKLKGHQGVEKLLPTQGCIIVYCVHTYKPVYGCLVAIILDIIWDYSLCPSSLNSSSSITCEVFVCKL